MPSKKKTVTAPLAEDLTPLTPEETSLVEVWMTASRAAKAADRIRKQFEPAMLALIKHRKVVKVPAGVIHLGESVSYDYPDEVQALEQLVKALKAEAKKDGAATMESSAVVNVEDFQQYVDPPATADSAALHGLKGWLMGLFKRTDP